MDDYRIKVKNRLIILIICAVVSAMIIFSVIIAGKTYFTGDSFTDGITQGFPVGLISGFYAIMLFQIVRCIRALQKEQVLKSMYIYENDERKKLIRQSALFNSFFFTAGILAVASIVSIFYNKIVAVTLIAVLAVHVFAGVVFKFYYVRKY